MLSHVVKRERRVCTCGPRTIGASDGARGWRARMCARLINIAMPPPPPREWQIGESEQPGEHCCSPIGQARHRDKGSVRRLCPVGTLSASLLRGRCLFSSFDPKEPESPLRSPTKWKTLTRVVFRASRSVVEKNKKKYYGSSLFGLLVVLKCILRDWEIFKKICNNSEIEKIYFVKSEIELCALLKMS